MAGFLTRSVPKPCIVLAPTARCVTCTLPVLTLVTCIKNVSLQNKLRPVNFYIDYFSRFHTIICDYFRNTNYPMTCHLHVRRLARLKGSNTFFAVYVARASWLWRRLSNDSRFLRFFLRRNLENLSSRAWIQPLVIFTIAKYHCSFVIESSRSLR